MNRFAAISLIALFLASPAMAQQAPKILSSVPGQSVTVTDWYKQSVYDRSNNKIGEVADVLLSSDGKVDALIVGVGGFLGIGEKDVAVPFQSIKHEMRDNKVYLTMDATKDELKAAQGLRYDRNTTTWVPDTGSSKAPSATTPSTPNRTK
jgi:sporulation protein YlmC with PRC-barrel domain